LGNKGELSQNLPINATEPIFLGEEIIRNTDRISVVLNTLSEEIRLSEEIIRLSEDLSISEEIIRHIEGINIVLKARYDVMILSDAEPRMIACFESDLVAEVKTK
jgi:hypothetical protein